MNILFFLTPGNDVDLIYKNDSLGQAAESDIEKLFHMAINQNFVPVTDDTGTFIGIITRKTILNFLIKNFSTE